MRPATLGAWWCAPSTRCARVLFINGTSPRRSVQARQRCLWGLLPVLRSCQRLGVHSVARVRCLLSPRLWRTSSSPPASLAGLVCSPPLTSSRCACCLCCHVDPRTPQPPCCPMASATIAASQQPVPAGTALPRMLHSLAGLARTAAAHLNPHACMPVPPTSPTTHKHTRRPLTSCCCSSQGAPPSSSAPWATRASASMATSRQERLPWGVLRVVGASKAALGGVEAWWGVRGCPGVLRLGGAPEAALRG